MSNYFVELFKYRSSLVGKKVAVVSDKHVVFGKLKSFTQVIHGSKPVFHIQFENKACADFILSGILIPYYDGIELELQKSLSAVCERHRFGPYR